MGEKQEFSFGDNSVARAYDNVLVQVLFEPWAKSLVNEYQPWEGKRVLDLATGTGIVAQLLSGEVGASGEVIGTDINSEMLALAKKRCEGLIPEKNFIESPAHPLDVTDNSFDFVVCQQGFQFFPDKGAAASEIYRVLIDRGKVVASTWKPVEYCEYFGAICDALIEVGEPEMADMMKVPFDFMPEVDLTACFDDAGFTNVELKNEEKSLVIRGGLNEAVDVAYATPIGPKLNALSEKLQTQFRETFANILGKISNGGNDMGIMVSNVLSAEKPG